jgi:hypothetical protein
MLKWNTMILEDEIPAIARERIDKLQEKLQELESFVVNEHNKLLFLSVCFAVVVAIFLWKGFF